MSKELADRLKMIRHRLTLAKDRWGVGMVDETIAALRSEPVATVVVSGGEYISLSANPHQLGQLKNMNGQALYAAPSREDQRATDSTVGAGNSRETDDLSHPVSQQAHPSRTDRQEPGLSAEQIEEMRVQIKAAQGNLWAQEGRAALQKKTDALCDMALRSLTARDEGIDWSEFDVAYKKASETSQPQDWLEAALAAQRIRYALKGGK